MIRICKPFGTLYVYCSHTQFSSGYSRCSEMLMLLAPNNAVNVTDTQIINTHFVGSLDLVAVESDFGCVI